MLRAQVSHAAHPQIDSQDHTKHSAGMILSASSSFMSNSSSWILDSGATSHLACRSNLFSQYTPLINCFVTLPNGTKITVSGMGSVFLSCKLVLSNVLYIPSFHVNLISLSSLM